VHYSIDEVQLSTDLIDCIDEHDLREKITQSIKGKFGLKIQNSG
jgi:hypothetical protein